MKITPCPDCETLPAALLINMEGAAIPLCEGHRSDAARLMGSRIWIASLASVAVTAPLIARLF